MTTKEHGALAMIQMLTRIWVPVGTPKENVSIWLEGNYDEDVEYYLKLGLRKEQAQEVAERHQREGKMLIFQVMLNQYVRLRFNERMRWWVMHNFEPQPATETHRWEFSMGGMFTDDEFSFSIFTADERNTLEMPISSAARSAFTARWLPYFRRGLWLSGCELECTPQEKREWIVELTGEEIRDWGLKV